MNASLTDASGVSARIEALYGPADFARDAGVLHVTSVWPSPNGLVTIRITEHSPRSETDTLALNFARARADAIVVTGKLLRDEPNLRYELQGRASTGLHDWRTSVAKKPAPPRLVVLTSGRNLDLTHPALHGWARPTLFSGHEGAAALADGAREHGIDLFAHDDPSLAAVLGWCTQTGAGTVSIEAGPSTTAPLYDSAGPPLVDEVLVSAYLADDLPRDLRGGLLVSDQGLEQRFICQGSRRVSEPSGAWRFSRHVRR